MSLHPQTAISDVVSAFSHAFVIKIGKNPNVPALFAHTVTLSVLSVFISRSMLHFLATGDISIAD